MSYLDKIEAQCTDCGKLLTFGHSDYRCWCTGCGQVVCRDCLAEHAITRVDLGPTACRASDPRNPEAA